MAPDPEVQCPVRGDHMLRITEEACACCGAPINAEDDVVTDDEGYTFLEECWNP